MRYSLQEMIYSGFIYYEVIDTENNCDVVLRTKSYVKALNFVKENEK